MQAGLAKHTEGGASTYALQVGTRLQLGLDSTRVDHLRTLVQLDKLEAEQVLGLPLRDHLAVAPEQRGSGVTSRSQPAQVLDDDVASRVAEVEVHLRSDKVELHVEELVQRDW